MNELFSVYGALGLVASLNVTHIALINPHWKIPGAFPINWESWYAAAECQVWLETTQMCEFDDKYFALYAAIRVMG